MEASLLFKETGNNEKNEKNDQNDQNDKMLIENEEKNDENIATETASSSLGIVDYDSENEENKKDIKIEKETNENTENNGNNENNVKNDMNKNEVKMEIENGDGSPESAAVRAKYGLYEMFWGLQAFMSSENSKKFVDIPALAGVDAGVCGEVFILMIFCGHDYSPIALPFI